MRQVREEAELKMFEALRKSNVGGLYIGDRIAFSRERTALAFAVESEADFSQKSTSQAGVQIVHLGDNLHNLQPFVFPNLVMDSSQQPRDTRVLWIRHQLTLSNCYTLHLQPS